MSAGRRVAAPAAGAEVEPFALRPLPGSGGSCPRCAGPLAVIALRVAGWRSLLEGRCPRCGHRYAQDLPAGHGLVYPATLDIATGETLDAGGAAWFSGPLRAYWERPDGAAVSFEVIRREAVSRVTLLNCLDPVYGHSLLKLLNAGRHLVRDQGLVVLAPAALEPLVPPSVAELWRVDEAPARFGSYLLELEERVEAELARFDAVVLSPAYPHPHPSTYRLADHLAGVSARRAGDPTVVLSLRDDRTWGRTRREQGLKVRSLCRRLRARFPDVAVAAVGVGGAHALPPEILDLRRSRPTAEDERAWLALLRGADLAIGVHGSNMLLPSGLARATIELLPRFRYEAVLQATLVNEEDPLAALAAHRFVPGNDRLSDVSGELVARLATGMLAERERFAQLMLGPAAGRGEGPIPTVHSGLPGPHPLFARAASAVGRKVGAVASKARTATTLARGGAARLRARRLPEPPLVLTDRRGLRFELLSEQEQQQFILHRGHFEWREIELLSAYVRPGETVLDVGANIGAFSAPLARAVAPGGAVHAFEPHEPSRRRLKRTIELNGLDGIVVSALAVTGDESPVELSTYGPGYDSWATTVPRAIEVPGGRLVPTETRRLESTSLDAYCTAAGVDHVGVLKIDVEGGEPAVLAGAGGLLEAGAVDLVLVEVSDNTLPPETPSSELLAQLEHNGLRPHVLDGPKLVPFRSTGRLEFANVVAASPRACARLRGVAVSRA